MEKRFRFTKEALLGVQVPEGKAFVEVFDSVVREFGCRKSARGTMTMLVYKKVSGRPTRKKLGRYVPGPGGTTVESFRTKARGELGRISDDPDKWIEGERTVDAKTITLEGAFKLALASSKRGAMARRDWDEAAARFVEWMKKHNPHITTWARLRRPHVKAYLEAQQPTAKSLERGITALSPTRKRLLMQPVAQVARYMWLEHEIPNVAERMGLSAKLAKTPSPVYLADVLDFLEHLRGRGLAHLEAGAALAGLGGLQLLEVLRLTWSRVDLRRGLVEISGEVKNPYRNRVIPLPARCVEALCRAYNNRPAETVQDLDGGRVVVSPQGRPFDGGSWMNYSKLFKTEIRAWSKTVDWTAKDLRNCLLTLGALKRFSGDLLEQYVGHAPRSVTARNYIPRLSSASIGEAAELDRQMQVFKTLVVDHVEAAIKAAREQPQGAVVVDTARKEA